MPNYEYDCSHCGLKFERLQPIAEDPVSECPECLGKARRLISAGMGIIVKGSESHPAGRDCSFEHEGRTCCGREERCGDAPCGDRS